jgi:hypothetical protein
MKRQPHSLQLTPSCCLTPPQPHAQPQPCLDALLLLLLLPCRPLLLLLPLPCQMLLPLLLPPCLLLLLPWLHVRWQCSPCRVR